MSSDRPLTSWPPEESEKPDKAAQVEPTEPKKEPYVPHLFDLVIPTHRAQDSAKLYIPRAYLQSEAVDASLLLGHGASFTASRQVIPKGPEFLVEKADMGTWTNEKVVVAPRRPKYVVYKSARVSFRVNGEPSTANDRRALQSVLTEFHALLHPQLLNHPNIIDFLALAWGSNPFEPLNKLPVLVVEYADQGTLADLQSGKNTLPDEIKLSLCLGIAQGLSVLHQNGVVHGDVKPENVLICSHEKETFIAKLADFGFSIIEAVEASEIFIGGTRTWRAPESSAAVPQTLLKKTDVYSFGLLAWSIAIDGGDPFTLIVPDTLSGEARLISIDFVKERDLVIELSDFDHWIFRSKLLNELRLLLPSMDSRSRDLISMIADPVRVQNALVGLPDEPAELSAQLAAKRKQLFSVICQLYRTKTFYKSLESLFLSTLSKNPHNRNLDAAIGFMKDGYEVQSAMDAMTLNPTAEDTSGPANDITGPAYNITNKSSKTMHFKMTSGPSAPSSVAQTMPKPARQSPAANIDWNELGFKHRLISWQKMRDLEPNVQVFVAKAFLDSDHGPSLFCLSAFYLNGYGLETDVEKCLASLVKSAASGHPLAQAYFSRLYASCKVSPVSDIEVQEYLERQASNGSRMALQDLKTIDPAKAHTIHNRLKYGFAGVGAPWFTDVQMLHGLTQKKLMERDFSFHDLAAGMEVHEIKVNQRGDYIIHGAASTGCYQLIKSMIEEKHVMINQLNTKGETALLCACRSGHADVVMLLLDNGAKASIQATNGESPLHWLLSFDENINVAALGGDLIKRGEANVHAFTNERITHSAFPSSIDVDFQEEGTPLMWAVHHDCPRIVRFLLSHSADPNWRHPNKNGLSPLERAAYYHHAECLELMVNYLETVVETPMTTEGKRDLRHAVFYGPLVSRALRAADKFSMILRNGPKYLEKLHATLSFLQKKTIFINFRLLNRDGETMLYFAASKGLDEAVEFMLQKGWKADEINKPGGSDGRTPLLESVRWNRRFLFKMLRDHGADVLALARNPFDDSRSDWSALHIFANEAHNENLEMVDDLLKAGVPVDGMKLGLGTETPFNVAVRRKAFVLSNTLLSRGAELNALSTHSSLVVSPFPITGLGHIIALNARYSSSALQYMLSHKPGSSKHAIDNIVEPTRKLSAVHLAALVPDGLKSTSGEVIVAGDFDLETNRIIIHELLEWYKTPDQLNMRCDIGGKTALHLAVEQGKVGVVEELVKGGTDITLTCESGETAAGMAGRLFKDQPVLPKLLAWLN